MPTSDSGAEVSDFNTEMSAVAGPQKEIIMVCCGRIVWTRRSC